MDNVEAASGLVFRRAIARRRHQAEMARRKSALKSPAKQRGDFPESMTKNTLEFLEEMASPRRVTFSPYVTRKTKKIKTSNEQDEEIQVNEEELAQAVRKQCKMRMRYQFVRRPPMHVRMLRRIASLWSKKSYDLLQPVEDEVPRTLRPIPDFTTEDREYAAYYDSKLQGHINAPYNFTDRKNQVHLSLPSAGSYAEITQVLTPPSVALPTTLLSLQKDLPGVRRLCFPIDN